MTAPSSSDAKITDAKITVANGPRPLAGSGGNAPGQQ